jgi:ferredoxin-NADP reductase
MKLILDHTKQETADTVSFYFTSDQPLAWRAGQFMHYTLAHPNPDSRKTERYFTIASAPHEGKVMITTRFAGEKGSSFKKALQAMKPGDAIEADGPNGEFVLDDVSPLVILLAGGIGVTPYRSILLDREHRGLPMDVTLLYANRTEDVVFKQELEALMAKHPDFKIRYFIGDSRIDEQALKSAIPDLQKPLFFVSGPEPMVQAFVKMFSGMGIPEDHQKRDFFPGYDWP